MGRADPRPGRTGDRVAAAPEPRGRPARRALPDGSPRCANDPADHAVLRSRVRASDGVPRPHPHPHHLAARRSVHRGDERRAAAESGPLASGGRHRLQRRAVTAGRAGGPGRPSRGDPQRNRTRHTYAGASRGAAGSGDLRRRPVGRRRRTPRPGEEPEPLHRRRVRDSSGTPRRALRPGRRRPAGDRTPRADSPAGPGEGGPADRRPRRRGGPDGGDGRVPAHVRARGDVERHHGGDEPRSAVRRHGRRRGRGTGRRR